MTNRNAHRDENWQDHQRHEDASSAAERREREYYTNRQHDPSAANYPQYLAENRHRRTGQEQFGPSRHPAGPAENNTGEYRYGDQPRFSPLRHGGYDEVRHDSFGYTEVEQQPHSFSPYAQSGGRLHGQPHPGFYDPTYSNVGMNWSGPGYLHNPQQFQQGAHPHRGDPDYHQWREEQIRKLDSDYHQWRHERYQKFSEDFDTWRSSRPNHGPLPVEEPTSTQGESKPQSSPTQGATLPASGTKR